jgi:hypothetical protein
MELFYLLILSFFMVSILHTQQIIKNILLPDSLQRKSTVRRNFIFLFTLIFVAIPLTSFSQTDPLAGHYSLRDRQQFSSIHFSSLQPTYGQVHDFAYFPGLGDSLINGPIFNFPDSLGLFSTPTYTGSDQDIAAANLSGDLCDEVIAVWFTTDTSIAVTVSSVEPFTHYWTLRSVWKIPRSEWFYYRTEQQHLMHLRLQAGEFDGDGYEEFLLAYISADTTLRIHLYDTDDGVTFTSRAEIAEQKIFASIMTEGDTYANERAWVERFNLAVEDLDHDGTSEVILVGVEPDGAGTANGFLKVYDIEAVSNTFIPRGKSTYFPGTTYLHHRIKTVVGEVDTLEGMECVIGWRVFYDVPRLLLARISEDLLTISLGQDPVHFTDPYYGSFNLACGDLNYDDIEEIILCKMDSLQIYRSGDNLGLIQTFGVPVTSGFGGTWPYFEFGRQRGIVVADVNSDSSSGWGPEILVCQKERTGWNVDTYGFSTYEPVLDSTMAIIGLERTSLEPVSKPAYFFELIAGRFDRVGSVRLGVPTVYAKSDIVQPLVIINAPPVHFDVFGGTAYDICGMWDGTPAGFIATYRK